MEGRKAMGRVQSGGGIAAELRKLKEGREKEKVVKRKEKVSEFDEKSDESIWAHRTKAILSIFVMQLGW